MGCNNDRGCSSFNTKKLENIENDSTCNKKNKCNSILIICTGNSCRSQMAEGWLRSFDERLHVYSAGTCPEKLVNLYAIQVMNEVGIDISQQYTKHIDKFIYDAFDYVITVCDTASSVCPVFKGKIKNRIHIGFEDPADAKGNPQEILVIYRKIRDQIHDVLYSLYYDMI